MAYRDELGEWYVGEVVMIKQIGGNFPNGRFSRDHAWSESITSKWSSEISWIVGGKLLLVNWLENCNRATIWASQGVAATGALIGQLRVVPFAKSLFNLYYLLLITELVCAVALKVLITAFAQG